MSTRNRLGKLKAPAAVLVLLLLWVNGNTIATFCNRLLLPIGIGSPTMEFKRLGALAFSSKTGEYCVAFNGTPFTDEAANLIANTVELRNVSVADTSITEMQVARITDSPNLTYLSLYGTNVDDGSILHLAKCKLLRTLVLSETKITDNCGATLKALPALRALWVEGTGISENLIAELQSANPDLIIKR